MNGVPKRRGCPSHKVHEAIIACIKEQECASQNNRNFTQQVLNSPKEIISKDIEIGAPSDVFIKDHHKAHLFEYKNNRVYNLDVCSQLKIDIVVVCALPLTNFNVTRCHAKSPDISKNSKAIDAPKFYITGSLDCNKFRSTNGKFYNHLPNS